jgi:enamine deaminase RidA (YjgF/YER057c/UK114 family)
MQQPAARERWSLTHTLSRGTWQELSLTLYRDPDSELGQDVHDLVTGLPEDSQIIRADVFGPPAVVDVHCPVTWVCPLSPESAHLGGTYLQVAAGASVTPIHLDGEHVGSVIETRDAREFVGAGIGPARPDASAPDQARQIYERMERALEQVGMDFSHVVRTWLFLNDILSWYDAFNIVRTAFFTERGVFDGLVPASTGIGAPNPYGWAIMTGVYAVKPKTDRVSVRALPSPLQCPALEYGSSFSRALEVDLVDHRRLLISGTASIGPDGRTAHVGAIEGQVALTLEVIEAILESRGMTWEDTTRATAYVLDPRDAVVFDRYRRENGLSGLPVVTAHSTICRDDLLFELEVDAVRATPDLGS